mmetsp:Transcript_2449/g.2298  ORF Transcript_2449/g.2298 Transcript_2449/m.2298 type:complete len:111 (-) Transcript_2449:364-696(-)|eukprot:CAMPEP_0197823460 /NCGR_PEP_ID=MMETSP1437-20131217/799_1 /TAXON_ID=49252 ORGANISM="Eucampia antarctica, Strain CCMP1452" /NCGR_SAMPLE_ID=MMETSP1437 /ASSEMBLY_ACC=CAM_ASM_001096 /LENGTH=110 /DNA_ID=CAMNT_0043422641 /DNA_START=63 /DNA_END=395 /DNA_ORIENTATION=+
MMRSFLLIAIIAVLAISTEAFAPSRAFVGRTAVVSITELEACRVNAKKEKRQRNRDNMRKFQKKRGTSRKKTVRKLLSANARQLESEFLAKCFTTISAPADPEVKEDRRR